MEYTAASTHAADRAEWDALIGSYLPKLRRFATRHLPPEIRRTMGPDDLVQEVVMNGIRQIDHFQFRHEQALLAYLLTSIRHRIVDEVRRTRRRPMIVPLAGQRDVDPAVSPLQQAITQQNLDRYARAMARLPARDRRLIVLRVEQGLTCLEVAARLGMPSGDAVRMAVKRALERLKKQLVRNSSSSVDPFAADIHPISSEG